MQMFLTCLFILFLNCPVLFAQTDTAGDFNTITSRANEYYKKEGKKAPGYKQFKRWEWYYSTRLGADGKLVNNQLLNQHALQTSSVNRIQTGNVIEANTGDWVSIGPGFVNSPNHGIGRINRIGFHPTNANKLYLASATGGLWISDNAGASWDCYTDGIPNLCLSGVAVDHESPNIIYILTGDADSYFGGARGQFKYGKASIGVLKSYDGGNTWHKTGLEWLETDQVLGYKLIMHPTNSSILLVATNHGIYRTGNGGISWSNLEADIDFYDIEFKPGNPSVVYASGRNYDLVIVNKSIDAGQSFYRAFDKSTAYNSAGNPSMNRSFLAVTPANNDYVYLLCGPATDSGEFHGVFRSTDEGENFTNRATTPNILGRSSTGTDGADQEDYDLAIAASPTNANSILTGGIALWRSSNGGITYTYGDPYVNVSSYYHGDIHDIVYHPLNNNIVFMCSDGGLYRSNDNGINWFHLNQNLQVTQYYKIATNPGTTGGQENEMLGGTQDNGTNMRSDLGGSNFTMIAGSDGMDCVIDPDNTITFVASSQNGNFIRSTNSGSSFEFVCNEESLADQHGIYVESSWCTPLAEITGNNFSYYLGYSTLIRAAKIGSAYIFTEISGSGKSFVKTSRTNANYVFWGDNNYGPLSNTLWNKVRKSTNGGATSDFIIEESNHEGARKITDLAFVHNDPERIWITYGGYNDTLKVRYSNNGGSTWNNITGSLPNIPINCIVYDNNSGSNNGIYIGTDIGVFYRNNSLGDWIPFSNNLPVVEVTDLEIHSAMGLLRAGTYGRGIWETMLYSSCAASLSVTAANTAPYQPYYFQTSQTITSTALHSGAGANVFYKAGNAVTLNPGFTATATNGNLIKTFIGPCDGGVPGLVQKTAAKKIKGVLVE